MLRLLRLLFTGDGHKYEWEIIKQINLVDKIDEAIGIKYILKCKHCGNMKDFKSIS